MIVQWSTAAGGTFLQRSAIGSGADVQRHCPRAALTPAPCRSAGEERVGIQRQVLQQDNGFSIHDLAIANGLQRPRQRPLQYFNVLTFRRQSAAVAPTVIGLIFGDKK